MNKSIHYTALFLLLLMSACQKKQDLVNKAFEGKNFDEMLERTAPPKLDDKVADEGIKTTQVDVLVDNISKSEGTSVFTQTGLSDRPLEDLFANDPEAPHFNFEEAPLYNIIQALCGVLGVNYIIDPSVKDQAVTINIASSDATFKTSELFDLVLKLHDLTLLVHENYVHVVPITSPEVNPGLNLLHGNLPNKNLRKEEVAIQVIPLKYVTPPDVNAIIKEFLSSSARIYEEPKSNLLIIVDKYQYIAKVMELIPTFDIDALAGKKMVFYQLANVDAVETTTKLQEIFSVYGYDTEGNRLALIPIESLNGMLAVSSAETIFKELDFWISKFDKEASFEEDQVFVYNVENTTADSISGTLGQIFGISTAYGGGGGSRGASSRRTTSPNRNPNDPNNRNNNQNNLNQNQNQRNNQDRNNRNNQNQRNGRNGRNGQDGQQSEMGSMIVDEDNNNIIFLTTPRNYSRIYKTLKKIDILPRQVFLEVTVLSVTLNDTFSFGIDWTGTNTVAGDTLGETSSNSFGQGDGAAAFGSTYTYVGLTANITASLAAAKSKGYANVLQQPHIMAIDNKNASISVGSDVPIQTTTNNLGQIAQGQGAVNPATSSTIQYRNTGVSLDFTPHINANGVIRLEITLDISEAGEQATSAEAVPISQNNLSTEMIVRDGQTVVMGGLIFDQEGWGRESVPLVDRIPIIKHLFNKRNSSASKRELIVMITPHLIDSEEKSIEISKEFKDKILNEFKSFKNTQY